MFSSPDRPAPPRAGHWLRKIVGVAAIAGALVAGSIATASSADAATARNGKCETGEFCYYFNSNEAGSLSDFSSSISDLGATQPSCYDFKGAGNGKGICVKNHAASVRNNTKVPVTVHFNSGNRGHAQTIAPGKSANLDSILKNQNAGHQFGSSSSSTVWTHAFFVQREDHSGFNVSALTSQQVKNIKFIIAVGKGHKISAKGIETAIDTSIVESWAYNRYATTDADSGGLFQQRPASGWGSYSQVRNKLLATKAFYGVASHTNNPGLTDYNYNAMTIAQAAQKVQRSAYPGRYQLQAANAVKLYKKYASSVAAYHG